MMIVNVLIFYVGQGSSKDGRTREREDSTGSRAQETCYIDSIIAQD